MSYKQTKNVGFRVFRNNNQTKKKLQDYFVKTNISNKVVDELRKMVVGIESFNNKDKEEFLPQYGPTMNI